MAPLFYLLESRNKIFSIFHQASYCYEEARKLNESLEEKVQSFSSFNEDHQDDYRRLNTLEGWLMELPGKAFNYDRYVQDLFIHKTALNTNIKNYKTALKSLQSLCVDGDELPFLSQFLDKDCQRFQDQIQIFLDNLIPGKELYYNLIEAIRGSVDIDAQKKQLANDAAERERDRSLQIWFTVVGSGLAISSISSNIIDKPAEKILTEIVHQTIQFPGSWAVLGLLDTFVHILIGLIFGLLVRVFARRIIRSQPSSNQPKQLQTAPQPNSLEQE